MLDLGANRRYGGRTEGGHGPEDMRGLVAPNGYAELVATARPGVSQAALADRVRAALPGRYRVLTCAALRLELARTAAKYVDGFLRVLLAFRLVALAVSGFVIFNTFSILV